MCLGLVKKVKKTRLGITLTQHYIDEMNSLVGRGLYHEKQNCLRAGLLLLFEKHKQEK